MEHDTVKTILSEILPGIGLKRAGLLAEYARLVQKGNLRFNLTGFKKIEDIAKDLIAESIKPLVGTNVPRGTFADIGTGAGTPGIPVSVFFPEVRGKLIDSNAKKIQFISNAIGKLHLHSLEAVNARLEIFGRDPCEREKFDLVLSRALGTLSLVSELGSPLLKVGGFLYIYSKRNTGDISQNVVNNCQMLSLEPVNGKILGIKSGIIFRKTGNLDNKYPRKYSAIIRESLKIDEYNL